MQGRYAIGEIFEGRHEDVAFPIRLASPCMRFERVLRSARSSDYFRKNSHRYRWWHLKNRLGKDREAGNEDAEKRILEIIDREKQRLYW